MANNRQLIKELITQDLGYCCLYGFFNTFRQTARIADRLGVTTRAIKIHKARVRDGCAVCEEKENCLKAAGVLKKYRRR